LVLVIKERAVVTAAQTKTAKWRFELFQVAFSGFGEAVENSKDVQDGAWGDSNLYNVTDKGQGEKGVTGLFTARRFQLYKAKGGLCVKSPLILKF